MRTQRMTHLKCWCRSQNANQQDNSTHSTTHIVQATKHNSLVGYHKRLRYSSSSRRYPPKLLFHQSQSTFAMRRSRTTNTYHSRTATETIRKLLAIVAHDHRNKSTSNQSSTMIPQRHRSNKSLFVVPPSTRRTHTRRTRCRSYRYPPRNGNRPDMTTVTTIHTQ